MKFHSILHLSHTTEINHLFSEIPTALIRPVPVSIVLSLVSPILIARIWAPGATPFRSGSSGKYPAAILATCVPCAPVQMKSM